MPFIYLETESFLITPIHLNFLEMWAKCGQEIGRLSALHRRTSQLRTVPVRFSFDYGQALFEELGIDFGIGVRSLDNVVEAALRQQV
jgi:hypothetical protein